MKKIIALLLTLVMVIALGAGAFAATTTSKYTPSDKTLIFGTQSDAVSLCALDVPATSANTVYQNLLYDNLVTYNSATNKYEPGLATSWKYLDKYSIEFKIRKAVYTEDGTQLTSKDVLYSFRTAIALGATASYWTSLDLTKSYAPDDFTLVLVTKVTDPFIIPSLANIPYSIVSEAAVNKNGGIKNEHLLPIAGFGPYKVVKWVSGSYVKFERKANYWGDAPYYKYIEARVITRFQFQTHVL